MSLLETIKKDQFEARKNKEALKATLLTTLFSEAAMKGKNANRETTDEETVQVIQKFLKGVNETIGYLEKGGGDNAEALATVQAEKTILEAYLPKMASADEIRAEVAVLKSAGAANIGAIMKGLKDKFGSALDGKLASQLAKE
jgi:uncharacterized protein YqeY